MTSDVETERAATVNWLHSFADYLRSSGFDQMANGIDGATVGIERGEHLADALEAIPARRGQHDLQSEPYLCQQIALAH